MHKLVHCCRSNATHYFGHGGWGGILSDCRSAVAVFCSGWSCVVLLHQATSLTAAMLLLLIYRLELWRGAAVICLASCQLGAQHPAALPLNNLPYDARPGASQQPR
jgi:hypothetical protein